MVHTIFLQGHNCQALTSDFPSLQQREITVIELIARLRPSRDVHDKVTSMVTDFTTTIVYNIHVVVCVHVCVYVCVHICECVCVCVCVCVCACMVSGLTISSRDAPDLRSRECLLIGQFPPHDSTPAYKRHSMERYIVIS